MDEMLPPSDEGEEIVTENSDISLPDEIPIEEEIPIEDIPKEESKEKSKEEPKDVTPKEESKSIEGSGSVPEDEIDLDTLLKSLTESEDALKKTEKTLDKMEGAGGGSSNDIAILKEENARISESYKRMEEQLRKLMSDKSDLIFKNAELEAFGGEGTDPNMIMLTRNLEKAKAGDDKAKSKCVKILKEQLDELTGEDYEATKTEKKVDLLSAAESYNNASNPNIKDKKTEDDDTLVM